MQKSRELTRHAFSAGQPSVWTGQSRAREVLEAMVYQSLIFSRVLVPNLLAFSVQFQFYLSTSCRQPTKHCITFCSSSLQKQATTVGRLCARELWERTATCSAKLIACSIIRTGVHRGIEVHPIVLDKVLQRAPRRLTVCRGAVPSSIAARSGNRGDGMNSRRAVYRDGDLPKTNTPLSGTP